MTRLRQVESEGAKPPRGSNRTPHHYSGSRRRSTRYVATSVLLSKTHAAIRIEGHRPNSATKPLRVEKKKRFRDNFCSAFNSEVPGQNKSSPFREEKICRGLGGRHSACAACRKEASVLHAACPDTLRHICLVLCQSMSARPQLIDVSSLQTLLAGGVSPSSLQTLLYGDVDRSSLQTTLNGSYARSSPSISMRA